jgi:hypothetical protein
MGSWLSCMRGAVTVFCGSRLPGVLAVLILAYLPGTADAALITITFDDIPGMSNSPGTLVPAASQLDDQHLLSQGALFASSSPFVAVVDLTSSGLNHAISNPNGIGGVDALGRLSYGTPIDISFFDTTSGLPGVTDFVSIRGDQIAIAGTATLLAFGLDGTPLGSFTANDVDGGLTLTFSVPGIHRVQLTETSATIAFDNVSFNTPVASSVVPEPGTFFLLGTGVAGLVAGRRKRPA